MYEDATQWTFEENFRQQHWSCVGLRWSYLWLWRWNRCMYSVPASKGVWASFREFPACNVPSFVWVVYRCVACTTSCNDASAYTRACSASLKLRKIKSKISTSFLIFFQMFPRLSREYILPATVSLLHTKIGIHTILYTVRTMPSRSRYYIDSILEGAPYPTVWC